MKTNKAAGLDCAVAAEALRGGGDAMGDVIHCFCAEVCSGLAGVSPASLSLCPRRVT